MSEQLNSPAYKPGAKNLITDVPGLVVGNAKDNKLRSGVTVVLPQKPVTAAIDIRGGGVGTRETDSLAPSGTLSEIHGIVISGGSAFGLDAATGVQSFLRKRDIGFHVGPAVIPIVPQAILFDLLNGGDKEWGDRPPYQGLAYQACETASTDFDLGTVGAGTGATTYSLMGGLGSASVITETGFIIGALVAVNAAGDVTIGKTPYFWAAPYEMENEFGGLGMPSALPEDALHPRFKTRPEENTTLGIIATNAKLTKMEAQRVAIMGQTGLSRAIYPIHTPLDGDVVFVISMGEKSLKNSLEDICELGALAANTLARATARAIYEATSFSGEPSVPPAYKDHFA